MATHEGEGAASWGAGGAWLGGGGSNDKRDPSLPFLTPGSAHRIIVTKQLRDSLGTPSRRRLNIKS